MDCNIPERCENEASGMILGVGVAIIPTIMKSKILSTIAASLAIALAVSASGNDIKAPFSDQSFNKDSIGRKKTDADSLPIPAPGRSEGKVDSTPFREDTPRPVDPTPSPRPEDPPVPQPAKPATKDRTAKD